MASISNDPNGRKRIQFFDSERVRKTIRLGKVSRRNAESVKSHIEELVSSSITGNPPRDATSRWVADLESVMYDKLAHVGLIKPRGSSSLGGFVDSYIQQRIDVKKSTRMVYERVRRYLVEYFGENRRLRDITPADADDWRLHLIEKGLADNTIRRSCGVAKQFCFAAIRRELIMSNPFAGLVAAVKPVKDRFYFVSRQEANAVLDACTDAEFRLVFALARFGGLRVPSEVLRLRWTDIDWEHNKVRVCSPKTEHHEGGGERLIPLFPELRPYLLEVFETAQVGAESCISTYRDSTANLRTRLLRTVRRAGLSPWPKLWQNLRSTRETELADEFPMHVVCNWMGNSQPVAAKLYLQITDEHFDHAIGGDFQIDTQAAQNAAQKALERSRIEQNSPNSENSKTSVSSGDFDDFRLDSDCCTCESMGDKGLEPPTSRV